MANAFEFYYYTNCSTCKKADAFLRSENIPAVRREFFKHRMSSSEIRSLLERAGISVDEAVSTRSRPYQELGLASRNLGEHELIELMVEHPQLLRRPLLVSKTRTIIGFDLGAYKALAEAFASDGRDN